MLCQARILCRIPQVGVRYCSHNVTPLRLVRFEPPLKQYTIRRSFATTKKSTPNPTRSPITKQANAVAKSKPGVSASSTPSPKPFAETQPYSPSTLAAGGKGGYRESLLIYNAGTGKTVFISAVRLTGIFIFIFSACFIAPAYYYSADQETWMAPVVLIGGAIPILLMTFTTAPFVTYVHLALPAWARASHPRLLRYSANLPSTALVDITTIRWIWPRVTRLQAGELYIHKNQMAAMTLRRNVPEAVYEARKWYDFRPLKRFYVAGRSGKVAEEGVWENVVGCVLRGWNRSERRAMR